MVDHDVKPGHLNYCQVCNSSDLELIIDLGHQPLCDSLLTKETIHKPEISYPLRFFRCKECSLTQLDYIVEGETVYAKDYPYRSGITKELASYQAEFANGIKKKLALESESLCVDVGSNDGTLLTGFKSIGMRALGVEPTDIAKIAISENKIETVQAFFTEKLADEIKKEYGPAKVITMTNVFAHMAPLGEVMRGLTKLLDENGVFITESHYLLDVIAGGQYDTIYHEHIRTYSLKSLVKLFSYYQMEVFDVQRAPRYGGNIRAYVCRKGKRDISPRVMELLKTEDEFGLSHSKVYSDFSDRVYRSKDQLVEYMYRAKKEGHYIVGNSCPGRCSTLLNYCGIDTGLLPYLAEQPTSLKLGMFLPGMHIPIVENSILIKEQPEFVLLLAWHYAKPIVDQLVARGLKSKFLVPLPEFKEYVVG